MKSTTFVTAFIDIGNNNDKKLSWRYEKFIEIAKSGIQLCVYFDKSTSKLFSSIELYPNVIVMDELCLEEAFPYQSCKNKDIVLPKNLNTEKDTIDYMLLINSKIEFVHDAIIKNPWNSKIFAWIDFSISYNFNDLKNIDKLKNLGNLDTNHKFLAIPGCYDTNDLDALFDGVIWRFLGSFFIGDIESIENFYHLAKKQFPIFIDKYKTLVWEVNFWCWLEKTTDWKIDWYKADHNDSSIQIPTEITSLRFTLPM